MSNSAFVSLSNLRPELARNLESLGYSSMTPIQAQSLPLILAGRDVIGQGKTGSGKTAAFGLGLLNRLNVDEAKVQALILCPTRELADQVAKAIRKLARSIQNIKVQSLCGGTPFRPQAESLAHGVHIVVGTPGRVEDHLKRNTLSLRQLDTLVLDEADRMLDMGFQDTIDSIIARAPSDRQTLLFSATYPDRIQAIAERIMRSPELIQVEATHDNASIKQTVYEVVDEDQRFAALEQLLQAHSPETVVIFCNLKRETTDIASALQASGYDALALNGDLDQRERDETLVRFVNKSISILVATDVAARGLDIDDLDAVFNYQIANDLEVHVHRIGRTGRAGNKGTACTLVSRNERRQLEALQDYLQQPIKTEPLPRTQATAAYSAPMATLIIDGGRKQKVRPGDILGALTGTNELTRHDVGKIQISDNRAYVAINRRQFNKGFKLLNEGKLKGRTFRVRRLSS